MVMFLLVTHLVVLASCKKEPDSSEEPTTVSTTNNFWKNTKEVERKYPINGTPTLRETEIIEDGIVPVEVAELASQGFSHYLLPEQLVVERRIYADVESEDTRIAVELLDDQTAEKLTAFLDEKN